MISAAFSTLAVASATTVSTPVPAPLQYAQVIIRERVSIIRVPTRSAAAPPPITKWRSKPYRKCISGKGIAGAALIAPDKVDFILPGGDRVRAELESSCPALDYYSGFYLRPGPEGMVCARRDSIHARSGGECQIIRFRLMIPKR